jgi:hypothetical protein
LDWELRVCRDDWLFYDSFDFQMIRLVFSGQSKEVFSCNGCFRSKKDLDSIVFRDISSTARRLHLGANRTIHKREEQVESAGSNPPDKPTRTSLLGIPNL